MQAIQKSLDDGLRQERQVFDRSQLPEVFDLSLPLFLTLLCLYTIGRV
jgi:hypothetical protein